MRYLIIGPAWVGDMVMAQSLFRLLKQRNPDSIIDVLAPAWTQALLSRMPEVNEGIALPIAHGELALKKRFQLGRALRQKHYDQAIVLPNSLKSALIPWFARIPIRTGWMRELRYGLLNDWRHLDKKKYTLMIERFMALGLPKDQPLKKPYPHPRLVIDAATREACLKKFHCDLSKPIIALCPGAEFGPSKRWPASYYAEVAKQKIKDGYAVWIFGSANDAAIADEIQAATKEACVNLCGQTNLAEALDLLSLAKAAVCNDSGLMHMAAALAVPVVAVYGSTSPDFTPPLGEKVTIERLHLDCQPCFQRECPLKHWRCMKDLEPARILLALDSLLSVKN